jgi:outer membrane protein insertion porin family
METSLYTVNWFDKKILRKQPFFFSRSALRVEADKLHTFYQREGFLYATITPKIETDDEKQSVKVQFVITEGEPLTIREVRYTFGLESRDSIDMKYEINKQVKFTSGQRFRDEEVHKMKATILNICYNEGYPYASVMPDVHFYDERKKMINLNWKIDTGPKAEFGNVGVLGNEKIETALILNQVAFKKGMPYSQNRLDKSQEWIYELGVFQVASVRPLMDEKLGDTIFVQIFIKEAPRTTLKTGLGYGSEDKLRLMLELRKLGFFGGARRLTFYGRRSALEPYHFNISFIQPAFYYPTLSLQINPYYRKQDEPGYSVGRKGSSITLTHKLVRDLYSYLRYTYEVVKNLQEETVTVEDDLNETHYNKDYVTIGLTYENALPKFTPNRGFYISAYYMLNGIMRNSSFKYRKWLLDFRKYQALKKSVLAFRIKTGIIFSQDWRDYIPPEERFYSGGSASVRGWQRSQLGPLDENGNPSGGNQLLECGIELRHVLIRKISGVLFMDAGNVWIKSFKINELRYALGAGIRYDMPIGPLRFDLAKPVFDEKKSIELHFSIGHAF